MVAGPGVSLIECPSVGVLAGGFDYDSAAIVFTFAEWKDIGYRCRIKVIFRLNCGVMRWGQRIRQ